MCPPSRPRVCFEVCSEMLLLLTESTLYWLNLTWDASTPRNNTALAGCVKNWANFVATVGNTGTPQSSVSSNLSAHVSRPPSSMVPSLMTNATSVSSVVSDTASSYTKSRREINDDLGRAATLGWIKRHQALTNGGVEGYESPVAVPVRTTDHRTMKARLLIQRKWQSLTLLLLAGSTADHQHER